MAAYMLGGIVVIPIINVGSVGTITRGNASTTGMHTMARKDDRHEDEDQGTKAEKGIGREDAGMRHRGTYAVAGRVVLQFS